MAGAIFFDCNSLGQRGAFKGLAFARPVKFARKMDRGQQNFGQSGQFYTADRHATTLENRLDEIAGESSVDGDCRADALGKMETALERVSVEAAEHRVRIAHRLNEDHQIGSVQICQICHGIAEWLAVEIPEQEFLGRQRGGSGKVCLSLHQRSILRLCFAREWPEVP